jgi:hypothetical protein
MKIGEEVLIHGYIDEIRKDIVIIRNEGGYFGAVPEEIRSSSEIPNKWIPVSEMLPEERKKCLVTFKSGYVGIMCYASDLYRVDEYDFCDEKGKAGWFDYDRELGHYSRDDVIAWMFLPESYKAESEEKE